MLHFCSASCVCCMSCIYNVCSVCCDDVVAICNACCDPVTLAGSRQIGPKTTGPQGPICLEPDDGEDEVDGEPG